METGTRTGRDMVTNRDKYRSGRLTAKTAGKAGSEGFTRGVQPLGLDNRKDGLLYVPEGYSHDKPASLALMLHGAGAPAEQGLSLLQQYADEENIILIAPDSRAATWDIIADRKFGNDVIYLDQSLELAFDRFNIDTAHLAIGGFSDGASYAFSIGLTNGDLFTHIIAFSPGFAYALERHGKPVVYVSHGVNDPVLPIDPCGRRIVPQLKRQGIEVRYQEFEGYHEIPAFISRDAVDWFVGRLS